MEWVSEGVRESGLLQTYNLISKQFRGLISSNRPAVFFHIFWIYRIKVFFFVEKKQVQFVKIYIFFHYKLQFI